MFHFLKRAWTGAGLAAYFRAPERQVAALCYRLTPEGCKVLLVTSRGTGRWILPKGWPVPGKDGPGSALQEAWEEAGVAEADIQDLPLGTYTYDKGLSDGESIPIEVSVYLAETHRLKDSFPERDQRERAWFFPQEAARRVDEPELKAILERFDAQAAA